MLRRPDLRRFDESAAGDAAAGIFGLPFTAEESSVLLLPAPWEATTSYGKGTAHGPGAMLQASPQLDLFDPAMAREGLGAPWRHGIHMLPEDPEHRAWNEQASALAARSGDVTLTTAQRRRAREGVNKLSRAFDDAMEARVAHLLEDDRLVGVVGGDHSVPLGPLRALARQRGAFGILHVDAHADLRVAYEGFACSHASIMHNVLAQIPEVTALAQFGIRDLSAAEYARIEDDPRITTCFDADLRARQASGTPWRDCVEETLAVLPEQVYISFDIDGLDPALCPGTGTPVPGGLGFQEALRLIAEVVRSGRRVIGFDLCEVAPQGASEWDGNVGARVLYRLCAALLHGAGARDETGHG